MTVGWSLRPATEADRDFLFDLHRAAMREYVAAEWGWDDDVQREFFDRRWNREAIQVLVVGEERIGTMTVVDGPEELVLSNVEIAPGWQGRGIGTDLLHRLCRRAASEGRSLALQVLKTNPRARELYERQGLTVEGETDTHYRMRWSG